MPLKLASPDHLYDVPVTVELPDGETAEYTAQFRVPKTSDLTDLSSDADVVRSYLGGFAGIMDADGKPLPDNEQSIQMLAEIPFFARATGRAFVRWAFGVAEKNSATPLA